jgi:hypothetical protein
MRSMLAAIAAMISTAVFAQQQTDVKQPPPRPRMVAQPADGKSVADFFLTTCLSAVSDPTSIERMASEKGWTKLSPPPASNRPRWIVDAFFVTVFTSGDGSKNPDVPACVVGIRPPLRVKRDEFFDTISASLELKLFNEATIQNFHHETYDIVGTKRKLRFLTNYEDGTMATASIYTVNLP